MPQAEVTVTVEFYKPEGHKWSNTETVKFNDPRELTAYTMQQVAKVLGEGGVLEVLGPFEVKFQALPNILSVHCKGEPKLIDNSTDVGSAVVEQNAVVTADKLLRAGNLTQFRRPKVG